MKKTAATLIAVALAASLVSGCSMVKVSEAGKRVAMLTNDQVAGCTRVGSVSTSVLDNVIGIPRNDKKIQTELDRLARDQAVLMNANTLVRMSIIDGQGSYVAYNCY
ncbi:MAG: DUF4156 domain-containing protein [Porticoccaceae bacterium]